MHDAAALGDAAIGAVGDGGAMVTVLGWEPDEQRRPVKVTPTWVSGVIERTDWLAEIARLARQDMLKPRVCHVYAPEQAADAQRATDAGGPRVPPAIRF